MKPIKIIVEKHPEGYVAYPLGLKGVVVGEGNTYEEALADVKSAIKFHIKIFGEKEALGAHETIKGPTLRTICTQAGIPREEFLKIYEKI